MKWVYKYLLESVLSILWTVYPEVELLDHMEILCLIFWGISVLFSTFSIFAMHQNHLFFLKKIFYLFIYLWLCWVFVSMRGLSLVAASGGHSSSRCTGLSLSRPLLLRSTGSRCAGSVVVVHGLSCSAACGIFPDQGSNPCPLHWQADSQPLHHQGSPRIISWVLKNTYAQSPPLETDSEDLNRYLTSVSF